MRARHLLAVLTLTVAIPSHAQLGDSLDASQLRALESQVANVYGMAGTEADFTEINGVPPVWSGHGHAVFARNGFVLTYATPPGRRVVADFARVRVIDSGRVTERRATDSPYAPLLVLTGARAPAFTGGRQHGALYWAIGANGPGLAAFNVDMKTSRVLGVNFGRSDITFTNIHMLASNRAIPIVQAALAP